MGNKAMRVGAAARATGVSVRTLHHYDQIGLLRPSLRNEGGQRLYTVEDMARLRQILLLRMLGLSLAQIADALDDPEFNSGRLVQEQLDRLDRSIQSQQLARSRLLLVQEQLGRVGDGSIANIIMTIRVIMMYEHHYTDEQLRLLKERREMLGDAAMQRAEADWRALIDRARELMQAGADPAGEAVQDVARRWGALVAAFTGADAGIEQSLQTMYRTEGATRASYGMVDEAVMRFIERARRAGSR